MIRVLFYAALLCCGIWSAQAATGLSADETRLLQLLNQERGRMGLPIFVPDPHLMIAARLHSQQMANRSELSHQLTGETPPSDRMAGAGAAFTVAAENVAFAGSLEQAHDGLMHSPPHLTNIKSPDYHHIGLGIVRQGDRVWVTEDFARILPALSDEQFRVSLLTALNRLRQRNGLDGLLVSPAPALHSSACAERGDLRALHREMPDAAGIATFTAAEPDTLPGDLDRLARDPAFHRLSLGVCERPGVFASFSVVAAFYP